MKKSILLLVTVIGMFLLSLWAKGLWFPGMSNSIYYPTVWALIWAGVAFWLAEDLSNSSVGKFPVYILSGAIGAAAGWLIGIYFFPKNADEAARFQTIGSVIGTFLSGYLLKEFGDVWKYLATPASAGATPPILQTPRREYAAFFLASLLISGGVQYGMRTFERIYVGWNGQAPSADGTDKGRLLIPAGFHSRLSGATDSGDNPALRWSVESPTNPDQLKIAKEKRFISLDADSGVITLAEKGGWNWVEKDGRGNDVKREMTDGFNAQIIATSIAHPELAKALEVRIDPNKTTLANETKPSSIDKSHASSTSSRSPESTGSITVSAPSRESKDKKKEENK